MFSLAAIVYELLCGRRVTGTGSEAAESLSVSSTKSVHGHALGAAGAIELIAAINAMRHGVIPPTANFMDADRECDLDYTPNVKREAKIDTVLTDNLGFSGHNAALVFKRA